MGTTLRMLSNTEFQPQCVTKPPVEGCPRISACGAHNGTTRPVSFVLSKKPSGKYSGAMSPPLATSKNAPLVSSSIGGRTTQTNLKF
ncbi:hypothetical protein Lal_00007954 [Lupinus albus]|nr:hypothetical protein Lal_00007954 [Lupinus albus]